MKLVRLLEKDLEDIKNVIIAFVGNDLLSISIFGSRANLQAAGGDIDILLHIESGYKQLRHDIQRLKSLICDKIGEQKIDIFICPKNSDELDDYAKIFYNVIKEKSVVIWKR